MLLFAKFLQFIKLLFDFMNVVLTIRKHFSVNSFKIINITKFDAADPILMITKYNERFGFYFINELMYFFVYLVTPDADLLFFCMVYYFDGNFDRITLGNSN
ncbi:putative membrane protein [Paenibacillus riograndensis SBR5]|uniref:Putative membrane protein n=2 Tax=Paenibacillus riograndensis TaxID=483937 RepID=A0A0E4H753_9BACL|nr:putative membrane protein [Paenibacillus riograndensis SBR5]